MNMNNVVGETSTRGVEAEYFATLEQGNFVIQRCSDCERAIFYPRQFCPHCDSEQVVWERASGLGTVHSTTTVRIKPDHSYNVSVIELDEGVRMMSRVDGISPEEVKIGMRVQARIIQQSGKPVVVFDVSSEVA